MTETRGAGATKTKGTRATSSRRPETRKGSGGTGGGRQDDLHRFPPSSHDVVEAVAGHARNEIQRMGDRRVAGERELDRRNWSVKGSNGESCFVNSSPISHPNMVLLGLPR